MQKLPGHGPGKPFFWTFSIFNLDEAQGNLFATVETVHSAEVLFWPWLPVPGSPASMSL